MRRLSLTTLLTGFFCLGVLRAGAQTSYPMLISLTPLACRRGETTEVRVTGRFNLQGAFSVYADAPGVSGEVIPPAEADRAKATDQASMKLTVAGDARPGPAEIRIMTPRGISSVGQVVIGDEPPCREKEPNNQAAQATTVELPAVLDGVVQAAEDVDCYRFKAKSGETLVFNCLSARLQDKIHDLTPGGGGTHSDPILVLLDGRGKELALSDDTIGADPILTYDVAEDGDYVLLVRDVRYSGSPGWTYAITATNRPYVLGFFPMAARRGTMTGVQPIGYNLGSVEREEVPVPMSAGDTMPLSLKCDGRSTNVLPLLVSDHPQFTESGDNNSATSGTRVEIPGGWNGRIETENDVDYYRFKCGKGVAYAFEVNARRFGSALDSAIEIVDDTGRVHASNDDAAGKDSALTWTSPDEREYCLKITDLHGRGGRDFVYHVAAAPATPDFSLQCDDDKALVGAGGGYAMFILATRKNGFTGDIKLTVENLPPGVTSTTGGIPASMSAPLAAAVILRAPADAKPDYRAIRVVGAAEVTRPDGTKETLRRVAEPLQEIYMPGGGRSRFRVASHIVSVTEPADVILKVSPSRLALKPGTTATIDVEVVRQRGYDKNVVLDVILRHLGSIYANPLPPGVTMEGSSKTLLGPKDTRGTIVLRAADNAAEIRDLPIAVLGQVSVNFVVKVSHASEPVYLTVAK